MFSPLVLISFKVLCCSSRPIEAWYFLTLMKIEKVSNILENARKSEKPANQPELNPYPI